MINALFAMAAPVKFSDVFGLAGQQYQYLASLCPHIPILLSDTRSEMAQI